eukprot:233115-Chlamydomonas_euryale.AAC.2
MVVAESSVGAGQRAVMSSPRHTPNPHSGHYPRRISSTGLSPTRTAGNLSTTHLQSLQRQSPQPHTCSRRGRRKRSNRLCTAVASARQPRERAAQRRPPAAVPVGCRRRCAATAGAGAASAAARATCDAR